MTIKIKKSTDYVRGIERKGLVKDIRKNSINKMKREIKPLIIDEILRGVSPVSKGGRKPQNTGGRVRYKAYSDSYKKQIEKMSGKSIRPVNLKVTGNLLNSLKARLTKKGLTLFFSDFKAKYHDRQGAGKSKIIRRMLPSQKGEVFNKNISKTIFDIINNAVKKSTRR